MARLIASAAAAVAVHTDLLDGNAQARRPWGRMIIAVGFCGSAAIGDALIDLFVEDTKVMDVANTKLGLFPNNDDMVPCRLPIPAGALLRAVVHTTLTTNAGNLVIDTVP